MLLNSLGYCSFVGSEDGFNLLILGLRWSESKALITVSEWIVTILWAFGTPSLSWSLLEEINWVWRARVTVGSDLSELFCESEDWASSVSVIVSSFGKSLSDEPRKVFPELIFGGGEINLVGLSFSLSS